MRRLTLSLLCLSSLLSGAGADVICALGPGAAAYDRKSDQRPTADAMELARTMNKALAPNCTPQCPQIAIFRNPTAPNAMLLVTAEQAKFVYSPQFFSAVYDQYGDGAIIAIMAHQFGHALNEMHPASWIPGDWSPELRADAWSGCALAKSDLSANELADAVIAVAKYPPPGDSNWPMRAAALRLGYVHCGGNGAAFDAGAGGGRRN